MPEAPGVRQRTGLEVKTGVMFPGCLRESEAFSSSQGPHQLTLESQAQAESLVLQPQGQSPAYSPVGDLSQFRGQQEMRQTRRLLS